MKDVSGWYCPRCKGINAPFVLKCDCKEVIQVRLEGKVSEIIHEVEDDPKICELFSNETRILNALRLNGINNLSELIKLSWREVSSIHNLGRWSIYSMRKTLGERNIVLEER